MRIVVDLSDDELEAMFACMRGEASTERVNALTSGVAKLRAAQQSVQRTCAKCGSTSLPVVDAAENKTCAECGASR